MNRKNKNTTIGNNLFVKQGNAWNIKAPDGRVVKRLGVLDAFPLLSTLVVKNDENLYGLIGLQGEYAQPCQYLEVSQPLCKYHSDERYEIICLKCKNHKYMLADKYGNIVTSQECDDVAMGNMNEDRFSGEAWNGFVSLRDGDRHGLFDAVHVKEIIPPIYSPGAPDVDYIYGIDSVGIPIISNENGYQRTKLINAKGEELIPFEAGYSYIGVVSPYTDEYLIPAAKNGKFGYINIHGTEKIPFKYDEANQFSNGYAVVGYHNRDIGFRHLLGVIDHHNKEVIPFMFDDIKHIVVIDGKVFVEGIVRDSFASKRIIMGENRKIYECENESYSYFCSNMPDYLKIEDDRILCK